MTPKSPPSHWKRLKYGDALVETNDRAGQRTSFPVLSVTKTRGPMLAAERFAKVMHSRDLSRYRIAPRNSVVADPMLLWDGSIGIQKVVDVGLVSPDYRVYSPTPIVDACFIAYLVRSPFVRRYYQGSARGTNVRRNRIARSDFLSIPLWLPPLPEQRKIAAILASFDDAIEAMEAVINQIQVVKEAMMAEMSRSHAEPMRSVASLIAEHGGEVKTGPFGTVLRADEQDPKGTPLISVREIRDGFIEVVEDTPRVPARVVQRLKYFALQEGDIVFARKRAVDRCAVVGAKEAGWMMGSDCIRVRLPECLDPSFSGYWFRTPEVKSHILGRSVGSTTMVTLTQGTLESIRFPVPPLALQREIATRFRSLDTAADENRTTHQQLLRLKAALMSALLTGELRVTPDAEAAA